MKKIKSFLLIILGLLSLFASPLSGYEHDFAICTIFKNEARWLKEFIEHHTQIGCTHFYLYDNNSEDHPREILAPYIETGLVELILWEPPIAPHWGKYQEAPYEDCLERAKGEVKWLAIIDADEFIMPIHGADWFKSFLEFTYTKKTNIGAIYLHWQCFGPSGIWDIPEMGLRDTLIRRKDYNYVYSGLVKYICRPELVKQVHVHNCELINRYKGYDCNPFTEARINHYQYRGIKNTIEKRWYGYDLCDHEVTPDELNDPEIAAWLRRISRQFDKVEDTTAWLYTR